ncbi:MAG: hypothetical protein HQL18_01190 [Candidatus Omnitrophica bacterium]|nr:hypothetical protein [Candidatus Omnitrophota bacterium]
MFRSILILVLIVSAAGCASLPKGGAPLTGRPSHISQHGALSSSTVTHQEAPVGFVFGKTDFKGLLKAPYVKLTIVRKDDPKSELFFYVGSKANQSVTPWHEGKTIEPGYFYLQLAPGDYEITSIAIPVGSTEAEETVALDFRVTQDKLHYLGTLDVAGTKEKVKLGGVPVMKPGFEYELLIRDEFAEATAQLPPETSARGLRLEKMLFQTATPHQE